MILIRAPKGLGNALCLRAVVLHLLKNWRQETKVFTRWPEVFDDLPVELGSMSEALSLGAVVRNVSYPSWYLRPDGKSEFQACCENAGILEPVELRIDWKVRNQPFLDKIKGEARGRKIFIFQSSRVVHNPEQELLNPRRVAFNSFVNSRSDCYRIKIGHPPFVINDSEAQCELDMFGKAFIHDTFDIASIGDLFFSQPSFVNILAESMDKRFACMFSRRALSSNAWVKKVTPDLIFHKKHLGEALYDD